MRLIDADALTVKLDAEKDERIPETPYDVGYNNGLTMAYAIVLGIPTVEVKDLVKPFIEYSVDEISRTIGYKVVEVDPVKRGRWKQMKAYKSEFVCSECGNLWPDEKSAYCPSCGARMDLEG